MNEQFTPFVRRKKCPKCGAHTQHGYGARGGGIGPYVSCTACGWFYKEQEPDKR